MRPSGPTFNVRVSSGAVGVATSISSPGYRTYSGSASVQSAKAMSGKAPRVTRWLS